MSSMPHTNIGAAPLIINGDDFGYSDAVNSAILQAHLQGVLTSCSLMINECAAGQAIALARANPRLAVGLHLVLVLGHSTLGHSQLPTITDDEGKFTNSSLRAGIQYFFSGAARQELRAEMRAQFEKFAATGLPFSHVDGHTHLHQHPVIFDELIRLCEEFNVRRVRVVKGEMRVHLRLDHQNLLLKLVMGSIFNLLGRRCERQLAGRDFLRPQKVYGLLQSGKMSEDFILGLLNQIESSSSEIYAHPLALDADAQAKRENPGGARELDAMLSPEVRAAIERAGFRLATYETI